MTTADLNHDGVPDLLVGGSNTVIFLGSGDGTFEPPTLYSVGNRFARIGYLNRDRDPDVVAGGGFSEIGVAFGRADGALCTPAVIRRRAHRDSIRVISMAMDTPTSSTARRFHSPRSR